MLSVSQPGDHDSQPAQAAAAAAGSHAHAQKRGAQEASSTTTATSGPRSASQSASASSQDSALDAQGEYRESAEEIRRREEMERKLKLVCFQPLANALM